MPRPRKTTDYAGTAFGALVGGALGGPIGSAVGGAIIGGLLGSAANPGEPVPLQEALEQAVRERGLVFVGVERPTKFSIRLIFGRRNSFFTVEANVSPSPRQKW